MRGRNVLIICAWYGVTRIIALGASHLGAATMTAQRQDEWKWVPEKSDLFPGPPPPPFLAPTVRWDANYYIALARTGYPPIRTGEPVFTWHSSRSIL